jgi:hypothetical protein
MQPCFADLGYRQGQFPHAERAANESLAIPIYGELDLAAQQTVVAAIAEFVLKSAGNRVAAGQTGSSGSPDDSVKAGSS